MYGLNAVAWEGILMEKLLSFPKLAYSKNMYRVSAMSQGLF